MGDIIDLMGESPLWHKRTGELFWGDIVADPAEWLRVA